jgi:Spy/CpxP family protein refolding chaperone
MSLMQREGVMKKGLIWVLVLVSVLNFSSVAMAGGCFGSKGKTSGLEGKFCQKVKAIYGNSDELGITDKQKDQLKALKNEFRKDIIRKTAEIDVLTIDIKAHLWLDPINTEAVNDLIDKKYAIKKDKTKASVKAIADLKKILTEDQKEKLKDYCKKSCSSGKTCGGQKGCSKK